jgi:hypothetical protein
MHSRLVQASQGTVNSLMLRCVRRLGRQWCSTRAVQTPTYRPRIEQPNHEEEQEVDTKGT